MYKLLLENKHGFTNTEYIEAFDYWLKVYPSVSSESKSREIYIDNVIDVFNDILPLPFTA